MNPISGKSRQSKHCTKMKFSINDSVSKCDQINRKLLIWSHLQKKFLIEHFFLCSEINSSLVTFFPVMDSTVNFKLDLEFTHYACFFLKKTHDIRCSVIFMWVCVELLVCRYHSFRQFTMIFCNIAQRYSMLVARISTSTEEIASYSK